MVFVDQPWLCPGLLKIGVHLGMRGIGVGFMFTTKAVTSIYLNVIVYIWTILAKMAGRSLPGVVVKQVVSSQSMHVRVREKFTTPSVSFVKQ